MKTNHYIFKSLLLTLLLNRLHLSYTFIHLGKFLSKNKDRQMNFSFSSWSYIRNGSPVNTGSQLL